MTQSVTDESFYQYAALVSEIGYAISGILISYRATQNTIDEMGKLEWYDPQLGRWFNKQRMKQLGGSIFSYQRFLKFSTISSIANAIESFLIDVKLNTRIKFDLWDASHDKVPHITDARMALALHNVIKHNQAVVQRSKSRSARHLVDKCKFLDGTPVEFANIDIERLLFHVYVFLLNVTVRVTSVRIPLLTKSSSTIRRSFQSLVPEVTRLSKHRKMRPNRMRSA